MKYTVDLHTHSIVSPDGGLSEHDYTMLLHHKLDYIAITDHNEISFAQEMNKKLGNHIIVGEEVMTTDGEIIGLFLNKKVKPYQSVKATIAAIHKQGGLVYVPHPFDMLRKGIGQRLFLIHKEEIDIVEGFNARVIFRLHNRKAERVARAFGIPMGVGSDAHTKWGIGKSYALVDEKFTRESATRALTHGTLQKAYQPAFAYLAPKLNRLKNML